MAVDRETGQIKLFGTKNPEGARAVPLRELAEMENDPVMKELFDTIENDNQRRGIGGTLPHRLILRNKSGRAARFHEKEIEQVEVLRKKRLYTEMLTGVITSEEYKKQIGENLI